MRTTFVHKLEELLDQNEDIVLLTGDLGFNAFEVLREKMGDRFINAGVAEQNMIGIAAGLAKKGKIVFCYSIAPFLVYRALEQIRNDICFHRLPVFLIGNGGGFTYGMMGPSHHALSDVAIMSSLPEMCSWIPAFKEDVPLIMDRMMTEKKPAYLRLGPGDEVPGSQIWLDGFNRVLSADEPRLTILTLGPIVQNVIDALSDPGVSVSADVFSTVKMPLGEIPFKLQISLEKTKKLLVIEEHILQGGLSQSMAFQILYHDIPLNEFGSLHVKDYPYEKFGDREYHLKASGLDTDSIITEINTFEFDQKG
jgi:transketolase